MDAAGRVFAEFGYERSTIRLISRECGTSLARLNMHWPGKEDLFRDVLARDFDPIHAEQYSRLDQIAPELAGKDRVRAILTAFFEPGLKRSFTGHGGASAHLV